MIPMTSVEVLADILRFAKDLTPLLSEKNLDKVISGLAEAREVVTRHKQIQEEIVAADAKIAKAEGMKEQLAAQSIELAAVADDLNKAKAEVAARELEATKKENDNAELQARLTKAIASYEKKEAKLAETLAKAEADAKEVETAKEAITAKLAKLAEVA